MTSDDKLFMVCDDTRNIGFDEIDLTVIPPEVLKRIDEAIDAAAEAELAAA